MTKNVIKCFVMINFMQDIYILSEYFFIHYFKIRFIYFFKECFKSAIQKIFRSISRDCLSSFMYKYISFLCKISKKDYRRNRRVKIYFPKNIFNKSPGIA